MSSAVKAAGGIFAGKKEKKAAKAAQEAAKLERKAVEVSNARQRRLFLERRRQAVAQVQQAGQTQGVGGGTSGVQGAISNIGAQFGENLGFQSQLEKLNRQAFGRNLRAQKLSSKAAGIRGATQAASDVAGAFLPF